MRQTAGGLPSQNLLLASSSAASSVSACEDEDTRPSNCSTTPTGLANEFPGIAQAAATIITDTDIRMDVIPTPIV